MTNTISLSEPTVDALIGTWTGLRLERGVSSTNLGSFALVTQIPYVAGQTTYVYADTTGAPSDWYRVARYGPGIIGGYSPPWPVTPGSTSSGAGARRSLKSCRRMLGRRLGSLQVITTTADGDAAGATIISNRLANQIDANRHRGWWAMATDGVSAGQVRMIGNSALNPTSGQLTVSPPMLSQIVQGTEVELHKLLPPDESTGTVIGLRECLNLALAECWVPDRSAITWGSAAAFDLSSLGDWFDPMALAEVYGVGISGFPVQPYGPYNLYGDAAARNLELLGVASGSAITVEYTRPADTLIKVAGAWTDGQQGFQNDDDECLLQPIFLTTIALAHAYQALANAATGKPQADYQRLADDSRRQANISKRGLLARLSERPHGAASVGDDWMSWVR
jgi:hypothetical protein